MALWSLFCRKRGMLNFGTGCDKIKIEPDSAVHFRGRGSIVITFENKNSATITVERGRNPRELYKHQTDAMLELSKVNQKKDFSAIIVLPTGAGKTLTSVCWLLKNAVNSRKKVLWIAHRHLLLEQAAEAFALNGYSDLLPERLTYQYRIVSGIHDRPVHIRGDEDILIAGKDSIVKNLDALGRWMNGEDLYLVIDEAHHAAARTYQTIINFVKNEARAHSAHVKMIGLTATPYRTDEAEKAVLGMIFPDDIIYSIDLDTLIKRGILSTPICKTFETHMMAGENISTGLVQKIAFSDNLPEDLANEIAGNRERNHLIVQKYLENQEEYQQTIVFALNIHHAIELNAVFQKNGVRSDFIVSDIRDGVTGVSRTKEENARAIEAYRRKELRVLINVNILTEGTDLPQTKTVFLTRPTVSKVLMTQMVGRALRGERAGGTKTAYIISFIDDWEDKISFECPETVLLEGAIPPERAYERRRQAIRFVAVSLIEEFARIADETVDTRQLENLPFSERIPLGMYLVSYLEEDAENEVSIERNHSVLVYNNGKDAYNAFLSDLEIILARYNITGDRIDGSLVDTIVEDCRERYFKNVILPPCKNSDIEALLKYFAYSGKAPAFTAIEEIDRAKANLSYIAQDMLDLRLDDFEKRDYLDKLWQDESTLLKLYYTEFEYFKRQLDKEVNKIVYGVVSGSAPKVRYEQRELEKLTVQQIRERDPIYGEKLRNDVFAAAMSGGVYRCKSCGMTSPHKRDFQIDHITPMSKGGLSVPGNLQLLCRRCNWVKSDHEDDLPLASREISGNFTPSVTVSGTQLLVRLGELTKTFTITPARRARGFMTFQIGAGKYRYIIRSGKVEKMG